MRVRKWHVHTNAELKHHYGHFVLPDSSKDNDTDFQRKHSKPGRLLTQFLGEERRARLLAHGFGTGELGFKELPDRVIDRGLFAHSATDWIGREHGMSFA